MIAVVLFEDDSAMLAEEFFSGEYLECERAARDYTVFYVHPDDLKEWGLD